MSVFPKVFGGMFRVIPTGILERVDAMLDEQIALVPDAAKDREFLKSQILDEVDRTGEIPTFNIVRRDPAEIAADEEALGVSPREARVEGATDAAD